MNRTLYWTYWKGYCKKRVTNYYKRDISNNIEKRKNNVFFRFSILLYIYKYSKL